MKELSIEGKAKAYDELIKRLNKAREDVGGYTFKSVYDEVMSELAESEDERIRKEIIDFLGLPHPQFVGKRHQEEWIAWLEKQGEQKPAFKMMTPEESLGIDSDTYNKIVDDCIWGEQKSADKVEPKFKIGDWVVAISSGNLFKILSVHNGLYKVLCEDGIETNYPFKEVDKDLRLWTIQDAKEGDVLEFGDHGRLVTGIFSFVNKTTGKVDVSCLLEGDKFKVGVFYNLDTVKPHPATKEQRDLLFKKMKEAGYEWDAEKKELKKIEQKPAWSEEDEKMRNVAIDACKYMVDNFENSTKQYDDAINWLKSLKERVQPQNTWKPNDEQMADLWNMLCECRPADHQLLQDIYYGLKKLREE